MDWKWIFSKELSKKQKGIGKQGWNEIQIRKRNNKLLLEKAIPWNSQFHESPRTFTILLISFLHANSGSLESIDVTVMPIVSGYFFVISFCQIGKASRYVIRKVISVQYLQAFLFIAIKFNTASCFLSQRSLEEESTSMLFFSVCCALPKNTVPICFLFFVCF